MTSTVEKTFEPEPKQQRPNTVLPLIKETVQLSFANKSGYIRTTAKFQGISLILSQIPANKMVGKALPNPINI